MHVLLSNSTVPGDRCVHRSFGVLTARQHLRAGLLSDYEVDKRKHLHLRLPFYWFHAQVHRVSIPNANHGFQRRLQRQSGRCGGKVERRPNGQFQSRIPVPTEPEESYYSVQEVW